MNKIFLSYRVVKEILANHFWLALSIISLKVMSGLAPAAQIFILGRLVDSLTSYLAGHHGGNQLFILIVAQLAFYIIDATSRNLTMYAQGRLGIKYNYGLNKKLNEMIPSKDLSFFESKESYNKVGIAIGGQRSVEMFNGSISLMQSVISIGTTCTVLLRYDYIIPLILLLGAIPSYIAYSRLSKNRYAAHSGLIEMRRRADYYSQQLRGIQSIKEVKVFGLKQAFLGLWERESTVTNNSSLEIQSKTFKTTFINDSVQYGFYALVFAYMIHQIYNSAGVTVGAFMAVLQSVSVFQGVVMTVALNLNTIREQATFTKDIFEFIDNNDTMGVGGNEDIPQLKDRLTVDNLSFVYDNGYKVLDNISVSIGAGSKIVIVGENGSGKTTFSKCILGLYTKYDGDIQWDGKSIRRFRIEDFHEKTSAVMQDFNKYEMSVRDNIAFGNVRRSMSDSNLKQIMQGVGLDLNLDDILGYQFGTTNISGGQWQRIAIARTLISDADMIVLDEPTSALDPLAEIDIYKKFIELAKGRTSFFVSHRLGICKDADLILVFDKGKIIEKGTHKELVAIDGKYREMFEAQAALYT